MDTEIKVCFARNPELSKAPTTEPGVGQDPAFHALPTARNFTFLISVSKVESASFFFFFCKSSLNMK